MKSNGQPKPTDHGGRCGPRVFCLREIAISYEGQDEEIIVKPPNLSSRGMFINTSRSFPEGAVLNLKFRLLLTGVEVRTRGEVRYCQRGVGIGVEFIGLSLESAKSIEREIALSSPIVRTSTRPTSKKRRLTAPSRRRR